MSRIEGSQVDFLNQEYITHGARNSDSILVGVNVFLIDSILVSETRIQQIQGLYQSKTRRTDLKKI